MSAAYKLIQSCLILAMLAACGFSPNVEALQNKLYNECKVYPPMPRCAIRPDLHPEASFSAWEHALNEGIQTEEEESCILETECIMDGEVISAESLADLRECANLFNGYRAGSRERYCVEACERDHLNCGYEVLPGGEGVGQPDEMADCVDSATACVLACPFIEAESES